MEEQAQVVIIGGGITGCSIAYHLARRGWTDVFVLEKGELTSGSTWHAAGLVGQLRSSRNVTRMLKHSVDLYATLEEETGQSTGWKQVGGLRLASSADRMLELKRSATTARSFGLEMHLLSPQEALKLFPIMSLDGVVGAAYLPTDGYADPASVAQALAKGARDLGVRFQRNVRVADLTVAEENVTHVVTDHGTVQAQVVVNAAGMWAREIGRMVGVDVPLIPVQHQYLVTDNIPGLQEGLPTLRDPDRLVYYKEEAGALAMGGYEANPIPWSVGGIPTSFGQELLTPDYDHFEPLSTLAMERTPILETVGIRQMINGPEAFTPDGHFIMGRAPELRNFYVAAGFNAHGIAAGGGVGRMMAEWITEGEPSLDLWEVDIRRFGSHHSSLQYVKERTCELYGKHYSIAWPADEHATARGLRRSPLYHALREKGAVYGERFGWERPNWYAVGGEAPRDEKTFGRPSWFEAVGEEHRAVREAVGIFDQTSFSKIEVRGPGAFDYLQWLAANDIGKPPGGLTYTQLLNERGGIECDLTIARLADDVFYIVTGTAFGVHDLSWIRKHMPRDGSVVASDVTSSRAVLNVCGPRSRALLEKVSDNDFTPDGFPFGQCREVHIGYAPVRALRVTYVGELGWELHIPTEYALHVYETLWGAGEDLGVVDAGYRAIESLRLEKGYRYWSTDLTADYSPYEAGLGFCVALESGDFQGREVLLEEKKAGLKRRLCCFTLTEQRFLHGGETITRQGEVLGVLTSGGWGYTVGKTIAYGYVPAALAREMDFEIEVLGEPVAAKRHKRALYDPERTKILA